MLLEDAVRVSGGLRRSVLLTFLHPGVGGGGRVPSLLLNQNWTHQVPTPLGDLVLKTGP